jgi:hypothetical protein
MNSDAEVEVVFVDDVHEPVDPDELGLDPDLPPPSVLAWTDWDLGSGGGGLIGQRRQRRLSPAPHRRGLVVVQESGGEAVVDDLEADSDEAAVRRFAAGYAAPGETVTAYRNSFA